MSPFNVPSLYGQKAQLLLARAEEEMEELPAVFRPSTAMDDENDDMRGNDSGEEVDHSEEGEGSLLRVSWCFDNVGASDCAVMKK